MTSRRGLLRAAATATAGAFAGCFGSDESGDGDATAGDDGDSDEEAAVERVAFPSLDGGTPTHRRWQPGDGEARAVFDTAYNFARLRDRRPALPAAAYENLGHWAMLGEYAGLGFDELEGVLVGLDAPGVLYPSAVAPGTVRDRLAASPYERVRSDADLAYYRHDYGERTNLVAVGEGGVFHWPAGGADDPLERFVAETPAPFAAAAGERPRLHERDPALDRYGEAVGWPLSAAARLGPLGTLFPTPDPPVPDAVAESVVAGHSRHLADGALVDRYWLWTREDGPADPAAVREAMAEDAVADALARDGQRVALRSEGRVVDLAVLESVADAGGGADPVLATVDAAVADGTLTVRNLAGDDVPLERVRLRGVDADLGDGALSAGEAVSVDADPEGSVYVLYSPPASEQVLVLATA